MRTYGPNLIGLSLSFCIQDVVEERVSTEQIVMIVTGTKALTEEKWERLITTYQETYWRSNPERAKRIVLALREQGKIQQPRVQGHAPPIYDQGDHWMDVQEEERIKL